MTYAETIEFLYNSLPVFHRIGGPAYKANLLNTMEMDDYFSHPHRKFRTIHIAGTNGKGSVSHMLASVLQEAGYKTGLYTSPHLKDYRERIRINGKTISEAEVVSFVHEHQSIIDKLRPSFFEMSVAMAFDYFARQACEVAVIEVGMGGRLDSTNIISPELSVITNISLDHTQFLGKTLKEIAREKAGIIKSGIPVIIGETQAETEQVYIEKARECRSGILFADQAYSAIPGGIQNHRQNFEIRDEVGKKITELSVDLLGSYQKMNLLTVYAALEEMKNSFDRIGERQVSEGIRNAAARTGLRGRWEILQEDPLMICDTAHNEAGLAMVREQLLSMKYDKLHFVFGTVKDKDPSNVLAVLPANAHYYFTRANIPRALDEQELKIAAATFALKGECYSSIKSAILAARKAAKNNDLIFIGGSNFVVGEAI